jgi:hypothetical protein
MNPAHRALILAVTFTALLVASSTAPAGEQDYRDLLTGELFKKGTQYTESIDVSFDVHQGGALSLGTTNGSVRINTWTKKQIRLLITKTTKAETPYNARTILEDFLVQARHRGKTLDLQAVANSESCKKSVGVTFEVWVPKDYNVDINTGSGNVDIGKIGGSFSAKTGKGKISFECDPDGMNIEVEDKSSGKAAGSRNGDEIEKPKPAQDKSAPDVREPKTKQVEEL